MSSTDEIPRTSSTTYEALARQVRFQLNLHQDREVRRLLDAPIGEAVIRMLAKPAPWGR